MPLQSPSGNLGDKRDREGSKFFKREIKKSGTGSPSNPLQMSKPRLAQDDPVIGSLSGPSTVGGIVGGLKDQDNYHGVKAGRG